jgi:hypothetical protein
LLLFDITLTSQDITLTLQDITLTRAGFRECSGVTDPKCIVMECMFETLEPKEEAIVDISFTLAEQSLNIDPVI